MFGLTFINSLFLLGLATAVLPIIIHLFSRRRASEVAFPSVEYLREISRQKVRRMRLRQWLLLALRVLILALFALAMGRPAVRGSAGVVTRGSSTLAVVLDNSYSMMAADPALTGDLPAPTGGAQGEAAPALDDRGTGAQGGVEGDPGEAISGTLFALAKRRASEILDIMGEGDRAILAMAGRPAALPFQTPVTDAGLLRREIDRTPPTAGGSDLPAVLDQVLPLLASARTINKELFIISDFQGRDIEEWSRLRDSEGSARGDSLTWSKEIPEGLHVYLVPVREAGQANVSVERLRFEPGSGPAGGGRLTITALNHGEEAVADRLVRAAEASNPGAALGDAYLDIAPRSRGEVSIDLPRAPADGGVMVRLGSDALEWDNRAYLMAGKPGVPKVLVASSDPTGFVRQALDPDGTGEFYDVRVAVPEALGEASWWDVDAVIFSNVGRLSPAAQEMLVRYKTRGGGVLIALGEKIDPRYYNSEILSRISSLELLSTPAEEDPDAFRTLRAAVVSHPIFAGFPIGPGENLGSARFTRALAVRGGPQSRALAEFGTGFPAIVEEDGVLLFTSSFDGVWNDFVTSASFPPLLHQMVRYLASRGSAEADYGRVGSRLEALVAADAVREPVVGVDPEGGRTPLDAAPVEEMVRLRSEPTRLPGIYRFQDASGAVVASFAVNLDPAEGDLAPAEVSSIERLFGRGARYLELGQPVTRDLLQGRYGRELWRPLLMLVLGLLVVESLLSRGRLLS